MAAMAHAIARHAIHHLPCGWHCAAGTAAAAACCLPAAALAPPLPAPAARRRAAPPGAAIMSSEVAKAVDAAMVDDLFGGAMPKQEIQAAAFLKVWGSESLGAWLMGTHPPGGGCG